MSKFVDRVIERRRRTNSNPESGATSHHKWRKRPIRPARLQRVASDSAAKPATTILDWQALLAAAQAASARLADAEAKYRAATRCMLSAAYALFAEVDRPGLRNEFRTAVGRNATINDASSLARVVVFAACGEVPKERACRWAHVLEEMAFADVQPAEVDAYLQAHSLTQLVERRRERTVKADKADEAAEDGATDGLPAVKTTRAKGTQVEDGVRDDLASLARAIAPTLVEMNLADGERVLALIERRGDGWELRDAKVTEETSVSE